jgi:hypothetical protein
MVVKINLTVLAGCGLIPADWVKRGEEQRGHARACQIMVFLFS